MTSSSDMVPLVLNMLLGLFLVEKVSDDVVTSLLFDVIISSDVVVVIMTSLLEALLVTSGTLVDVMRTLSGVVVVMMSLPETLLVTSGLPVDAKVSSGVEPLNEEDTSDVGMSDVVGKLIEETVTSLLGVDVMWLSDVSGAPVEVVVTSEVGVEDSEVIMDGLCVGSLDPVTSEDGIEEDRVVREEVLLEVVETSVIEVVDE